VVKHLTPEEFAPRLLAPAELITNCRLCHLRPFNGHHVQLPVLDAAGRLTPEVKTYLGFIEAFFRLWKQAPDSGPRLLYACPEMGPLPGGYGLSSLPPAWPCAVRSALASRNPARLEKNSQFDFLTTRPFWRPRAGLVGRNRNPAR
jgi:hypothetical protein